MVVNVNAQCIYAGTNSVPSVLHLSAFVNYQEVVQNLIRLVTLSTSSNIIMCMDPSSEQINRLFHPLVNLMLVLGVR